MRVAIPSCMVVFKTTRAGWINKPYFLNTSYHVIHSFTAAVSSASQTPCDHKRSPGTESLLFTTLQLGSVVHIARYSQNTMHHSSICWV